MSEPKKRMYLCELCPRQVEGTCPPLGWHRSTYIPDGYLCEGCSRSTPTVTTDDDNSYL